MPSIVVSLVLSFAVSGAFVAEPPACPVVLDLGKTDATWLTSPEIVPVAGGTSCCDPALEPGTNGIPFCFEGHTCCADGQWRCNNSDGTPGCTACGATCGLSGASCTVGSDCCSGVCKGNHKCK